MCKILIIWTKSVSASMIIFILQTQCDALFPHVLRMHIQLHTNFIAIPMHPYIKSNLWQAHVPGNFHQCEKILWLVSILLRCCNANICDGCQLLNRLFWFDTNINVAHVTFKSIKHQIWHNFVVQCDSIFLIIFKSNIRRWYFIIDQFAECTKTQTD